MKIEIIFHWETVIIHEIVNKLIKDTTMTNSIIWWLTVINIFKPIFKNQFVAMISSDIHFKNGNEMQKKQIIYIVSPQAYQIIYNKHFLLVSKMQKLT